MRQTLVLVLLLWNRADLDRLRAAARLTDTSLSWPQVSHLMSPLLTPWILEQISLSSCRHENTWLETSTSGEAADRGSCQETDSEQRHRAAAEQFTREQQRSLQANTAFQPLAVWDGLRTLQAEIGTDAAANNAVELLLSIYQPVEQRRREQHDAQSKPIVDNDDTEMADEPYPTPDYIERVEREFRDAEKRRDKVLRLAEDSKRRKTEQSGEVGSGGSSFREQA